MLDVRFSSINVEALSAIEVLSCLILNFRSFILKTSNISKSCLLSKSNSKVSFKFVLEAIVRKDRLSFLFKFSSRSIIFSIVELFDDLVDTFSLIIMTMLNDTKIQRTNFEMYKNENFDDLKDVCRNLSITNKMT